MAQLSLAITAGLRLERLRAPASESTQRTPPTLSPSRPPRSVVLRGEPLRGSAGLRPKIRKAERNLASGIRGSIDPIAVDFWRS